jgi:hypothetical protein
MITLLNLKNNLTPKFKAKILLLTILHSKNNIIKSKPTK